MEDHGQILTHFEAMFGEGIEHEVIKIVLQSCDWDTVSATEKLLALCDNCDKIISEKNKENLSTNLQKSQNRKQYNRDFPSVEKNSKGSSKLHEPFFGHSNSPEASSCLPYATGSNNGSSLVCKSSSGSFSKLNPGADKIHSVKEKIMQNEKIVIIMRGLPGSGKTTLANQLRNKGIVLSADDYFYDIHGKYNYRSQLLPDAHNWNKDRAKQSMSQGITPVIIDNTNIQRWEFAPYVQCALSYGYYIEILEPNTRWKYNPKELSRKTVHGVSKRKIEEMKGRFEMGLTIEKVLQKFRGFEHPQNEVNVIENATKSISQGASGAKPQILRTTNHTATENKSNFNEGNEYDDDDDDASVIVESSSSESENSEGGFIQHAQGSTCIEVPIPILNTPIQINEEFESQNIEDIANALKELAISSNKYSKGSSEGEIEYFISIPKQDHETKEEEKSKSSCNLLIVDKLLDLNREHCFPQEFSSEKKIDEVGSSSNETNLCNVEEVNISINTPKLKLEPSDISGFDNKGEELNENTEDLSMWNCVDPSVITENWSQNITENEDEKLNKNYISPNRQRRKAQGDPTKWINDKGSDTSSDSLIDSWVPVLSSELTWDNVSESFENLPKNDFKSPVSTGAVPKRESNKLSSLDTSEKVLDKFCLSNSPSVVQKLQSFFQDTPQSDIIDALTESHYELYEAVNKLIDNGHQLSDPVASNEPPLKDPDNEGGKISPTSNGKVKVLVSVKNKVNSDPLQNEMDKRSSSLLSDANEESASEGEFSEHNEGTQYLTLELDPVFASQLVNIFGPVSSMEVNGDFSKEDRKLILPLELCLQLYKYWSETLDGKFQHDTDILDRFIREDEELARKLQDEENSQRTMDIDENDVFKKDPPTSFREIVDLEKALDASTIKSQKEKNGNQSVSNLKMLQEEFSHIDTSVVESEYLNTKCDYQEAKFILGYKYGNPEPSEENAAFVTKKVPNNSQIDSSESEAFEWEEEDNITVHDPQVYRDEAQMHYLERQKAFQKAQEASQKGMKAVASYYAQLGNTHAIKFKEANLRASKKILSVINSKHDIHTLDLHLLHVPEALQATQTFLSQHKYILSESGLEQLEVTLITGKGNHSIGGQPRLKPAINDFLQREGYSFHLYGGLFKVILKP